jgi:exopolysaccharide biosynthesis polyprenyl glycosylphosphotransferase
VGRLSLDQRRAGDPGATPLPGEPPVLGPVSALSAVLVEHRIGRVILAPRNADADEILDAIRTVKGLGIKVSILPRLFEAVESSVEFDDLGAMTLLAVRQFGLPGSSRAAKRGLDIVGAAAALLVLAPVLAGIALAIRLTSSGPVLFSQTRIGRDGRAFRILKFRSMVAGADDLKAGLAHLNEADGLFKIAADPRITRVGAFLRATSLDELPQLWNVLRGEMSLVGPRPLVAEDDRRVEGWQRRRLGISPGMTGAWQLLGSSRIPLHEMVKIDYLYIANWTLWSDVKILLRTVPYVLGRRSM